MTIPRIVRFLRRVSPVAVCLMVAIGGSVSSAGPASVTPTTSPKSPTVPVKDLRSVDEGDALAGSAQILFMNRQAREVARLQKIEDVVNSVQDAVMASIERGKTPPVKSGFVSDLKKAGTRIKKFLGFGSSPSPPPVSTQPVSPGSWTSRPGVAAPAVAGGPRSILPSPWAVDMITAGSDEYQIGQINDKIGAALASVPTDAEMDTKSAAEIERSITLLGKVVYARTAVLSPPLGIYLHRDPCPNVILLERPPAGEDGILSPIRRPLAEFYEDITHLDNLGRMRSAVDNGMTPIQGGIRCINNPDMFAFEAAYVSALIDTYEGLIRDNKKIIAYLLIDYSLPLVIQFADAVHWFQKSNGDKIFHLKKDPGDVAEPENAFGLMEFLLSGPNSDRSTLSRFGVWLEDPSDMGKMKQAQPAGFNLWYPIDFVKNISDPLKLGEGNCSYLEMSATNNLPPNPNFICRIDCDAWDKFRGSEKGLSSDDLSGGAGRAGDKVFARSSSGGGGTATLGGGGLGGSGGGAGDLTSTLGGGSSAGGIPAPGDPGSPFTHFGALRSDLASSACPRNGEGFATPPPPRNNCTGGVSRGLHGQFRADPELDRAMACTFKALAGTPRPTITGAETNFRKNPFCREQVGDKEVAPPPDKKTPPDEKTPREPKERDGTISTSERTMNYITSRVGVWLTRDSIRGNRAVEQFRDQVRIVYSRPDFSYEEAEAALMVGFEALGKGHVVNSADFVGEGDGSPVGVDGKNSITIQEGLGWNQQLMAGLHATVHVALNSLEARGRIEHISHSEARGRTPGGTAQSGVHQVTEALFSGGGRDCGESSKCSDSCGHEDNVMTRFMECALGSGHGAGVQIIDPMGPNGPDGVISGGDESIPGRCFSTEPVTDGGKPEYCRARDVECGEGSSSPCCNGGGGGLGPPRRDGHGYATDGAPCGGPGERECDGPGPGGVPPIPMPGGGGGANEL